MVATTFVLLTKKRVFFLTSPWFQHLFRITYNISKIGRKARRQGSCQFLILSLQTPKAPTALIGVAGAAVAWYGVRMGMPIHVCMHPSLQRQNETQYAKPNVGYGQGTLFGVSWNLPADLTCP